MTSVLPAKLDWYARRLRRMSPAEVAWRVREQAIRRAWASRQVRPDEVSGLPPLPSGGARQFTSLLPQGTADLVPSAARDAILADAGRLLGGEWEMLGVVRTGGPMPISLGSLLATTRATIAVAESLASGRPEQV